jgi:hypothetical protein
MKKKFVNGILLMALAMSSVSTFVACKDYDEDVYVDLKSRISKEATLREALQKQVEDLNALVKSMEKCGCDLTVYLKKTEAERTYMKIADYEENIYQIAANKTAIELINKTIIDINKRIDEIKPSEEPQSLDEILDKLNKMNGLILSAQSTADEALKMAKEGKCDCDLSDLEKRVTDLEGLVSGWNQQLLDITERAEKAIAAATKDTLIIIHQQETLDSLIDVVDKIQEVDLKPIIQYINNITNITYTKEQVDSIIKAIPSGTLPPEIDVKSILQRIDNLEGNTYTKDQIEAMIGKIATPDLSGILARIAALEARPIGGGGGGGTVDLSGYYTKAQVNSLISGLGIPGLTSRLETLEAKDHYTKAEIISWIKANAPGYDDTDIQQRLTTAENALTNIYTKTQVDALISGLGIPGLTSRLETLEGKKFWTQQEIIDLIKANAPGYDDTDIKQRLTNLENNTYTKSQVYTKTEIDNLLSQLNFAKKEIEQVAAEALERAKNDSIWIKKEVTGLEAKATDHETRIATLETKVGTLETKVDNIINTEIPGLKTRLTTAEGKISTIETTLATVESDVATLKTDAANLKEDEKNMITGLIVQATQNPVVGYLNMPLDVRSTLLSVYYGKPLADWEFPSKNSANYVNAEDINVWTARNVQILGDLASVPGYVSGSAGETIVTQKDGSYTGNAGTLYVTVNPSNVDFTGKELAIKDSKDADAPITLSPLEKSDRQLTFGWTRAASNGFYEAKATLPVSKVEQARIRINFNEMESDLKSLLKNKSKSDAIDMAATLLRNIQDVTPAYAVMGSWTDKANGDVHNLYSQYSLGAAAISPLSFSFMNGYKMDKFPGIDRVQALADELIDKIKINFDLGLPNFAKYKGSIEFKNFELITSPTLAADLLRVTFNRTFSIKELIQGTGSFYDPATGGTDTDIPAYIFVTNFDGQFAFAATDNYGSTTLMIYDTTKNPAVWRPATKSEKEGIGFGAISGDKTVEFKYDKDFTADMQGVINDLIAAFNNGIISDVNKQFGKGSDLDKSITSLMNDVASLGNLDSKINKSVSDAKADIKSQLGNLITKVNNKLTSYFNRLPGILHLALVANTNDKAGLLSRSKVTPTKASSDLTLVPTTYSLEMFAPAYKKFVAVTDVFNADGSEVAIGTAKSMAQAANGTNMGKVIDSDATCVLNAGQSDYIYEITYTAVDYFGKVAIRKYYVKF